MELFNWAGNQTFHPTEYVLPRSVAELQDTVRAASLVRVLGSRHSFNEIADTSGVMVSLADLGLDIELDRAASTVTVPAGTMYGQLGKYLQTQGYALHNLASLPHISVGGAVATGTHGSGSSNGNLAAAVVGLEMVMHDGSLLTMDANDERFAGAVVGLGSLGVVTVLKLRVEPTFQIWQTVYEGLPFDVVLNCFDDVMDAAYSVSLFTNWRGDTVQQAWLKSRSDTGRSEFFGAMAAEVDVHPVGGDPLSCTKQCGTGGSWLDRLPHFRLDHTPSHGAEIQSEYLMPRQHFAAAIEAMRSIGTVIAPLLMVCEIRTVATDDLWLSSSYQQDTVAFHFTWKPNWPELVEVLPLVEAALDQFNPRPHWGKTFTTPPARLRSLHPRLDDFHALADDLDPAGKFRNPFITKTVFGGR